MLCGISSFCSIGPAYFLILEFGNSSNETTDTSIVDVDNASINMTETDEGDQIESIRDPVILTRERTKFFSR